MTNIFRINYKFSYALYLLPILLAFALSPALVNAEIDPIHHEDPGHPAEPECEHIIPVGSVTTDGKAVLNVQDNACPIEISFSTYSHNGTIVPFEDQVLTGNITDTYGPGTYNLGPLPLACNWQADLYVGPVQEHLIPEVGHTGIIAFQYIEHQDCDGEPPVNNMCPLPDSSGDATNEVIHESGNPAGEVTLQEILDNAGYDLNANTDQKQYQVWNVNPNSEVIVNVAGVDDNTAFPSVFGYYTNGNMSSFNPIFKQGTVPGSEAVPLASAGPFTIHTGEANTIGFAIAFFNPQDGAFIGITATQSSFNTFEGDKVLVYNPSSNKYILAFEDFIDNDYQDLVVEITLSCQLIDDDQPNPVIASLTANPASINQGATSTLSWTSTNTNICNAAWTTSTSTSGTQVVTPGSTTIYSITCGNGNATSTATTTVTVVPPGGGPNPVTVSLSANPSQIIKGDSTILSWTSTNTNICNAAWTTATSTSGTQSMSPVETTTYSITCGNGNASSTATTTVTVTAPTNGGGSGGGGGGGSSHHSSGGGGGVVLGTSTGLECFYLKDYMRRDFNNNPVEVLKLQAFLINFEGHTNVSLTGVFDQATFDAVSAFQVKYFKDILEPWGHTGPTGYVYILTLKKINEIYCQRIFPLNQAQINEIAAFRALLESLRSQGVDAVLPPGGQVGGVSTTTIPEAVSNDSKGQNLDCPRCLTGVLSAWPGDLVGITKCLYWPIVIAFVLYVLATLLSDVLYKNTPENSRKKFLTKWLIINLGLIVGLILTLIFAWFCLIIPLLILLAAALIWGISYPEHNSVRASVKSWYLVGSARAKTIMSNRGKVETPVINLPPTTPVPAAPTPVVEIKNPETGSPLL